MAYLFAFFRGFGICGFVLGRHETVLYPCEQDAALLILFPGVVRRAGTPNGGQQPRHRAPLRCGALHSLDLKVGRPLLGCLSFRGRKNSSMGALKARAKRNSTTADGQRVPRSIF